MLEPNASVGIDIIQISELVATAKNPDLKYSRSGFGMTRQVTITMTLDKTFNRHLIDKTMTTNF